MRKIKVLNANVGNFGKGGLSVIAMNLADNLEKEKFKIDYMCYDKILDEKYYQILKEKNSKIIELNLSGKKINKFITGLYKIYKILKEENYDIIHIHSDVSYSVIKYSIPAKLVGIKKIIVHSHSTGADGIKKDLKRDILHRVFKKVVDLTCNTFIACSEEAAKWMYTNKRTRRKDYNIVPNGIDIDNFKFNNDVRKEIRESMEIDKKIVIGNVARFTMQKNHKFLIEVFNEAKKINNNLILVLIGNGQLENSIKKLVDELGLKESIYFMGNKENVNEYMSAFDLFLLPSRFEGLGIVNIEAQASGLKCFVSDKVPKEAKVTERIEFLSLKDKNLWINKIANFNGNMDREKAFTDVKKNYYSIKEAAKILEKIYLL